MPKEEAILTLRQEAGAHLDSRVVMVFCEYLKEKANEKKRRSGKDNPVIMGRQP